MIGYLLMGLYIISCFVLILFVLLQPSKSDASGVFGGGANSAAFGPRGTQTVLAKVTIGAAITFFLIAFLFSIPGLFDRQSLGEKAGPAQSQPTLPVSPADEPAPGNGAIETPPVTGDSNQVTPGVPKAADKSTTNTALPASKGVPKPGSKNSNK